MFKNNQEIQVLKAKVSQLETTERHLTDAVLKINKRKQAEDKVKVALTPTLEELVTKHELDCLRKRAG